MKKQFTLNAYGLYSPLDALGALAMGARANKVSLEDWARGAPSSASNAFPTSGEVRFDEKRDVDDAISRIFRHGIVEEGDGLRFFIQDKKWLSRNRDMSLFVPCDLKRFKAGLPQPRQRLSVQVNGDMLMRLKDYIGNEWTGNGVNKLIIPSDKGHAYVYAPERLQFLEHASAMSAPNDAKSISGSLDFIKRFKPDFSMGASVIAARMRQVARLKGNDGVSSFVIGSHVKAEEIKSVLESLGCAVDVIGQRDTMGHYDKGAILKIERDGEGSYIGLNNAALMGHDREYLEHQPNIFTGLSVLSLPSKNGELVGLTRDIMEKGLSTLPGIGLTDARTPIGIPPLTPVEHIADPVARHFAQMRGFNLTDDIMSAITVPEKTRGVFDVNPFAFVMMAPASAFSDIAASASDATLATQSDAVSYALKKAIPESRVFIERDPTGAACSDVICVAQKEGGSLRIALNASLKGHNLTSKDGVPLSVTPLKPFTMTSSPALERKEQMQMQELMRELFNAAPIEDVAREKAKQRSVGSAPSPDLSR